MSNRQLANKGSRWLNAYVVIYGRVYLMLEWTWWQTRSSGTSHKRYSAHFTGNKLWTIRRGIALFPLKCSANRPITIKYYKWQILLILLILLDTNQSKICVSSLCSVSVTSLRSSSTVRRRTDWYTRSGLLADRKFLTSPRNQVGRLTQPI